MTDTLILHAVASGQLKELLAGEKGYALPNPYLDTPTDPMQVFHRFRSTFADDPSRMQEFAHAVVQLSQDPLYSWFCVYYLLDILEHSEAFGKDFQLQDVFQRVLAEVKSRKLDLQGLKRWAGAQEPEGCWGIVDRLVGQLKKQILLPTLNIEW
jgi:hypothetical protein